LSEEMWIKQRVFNIAPTPDSHAVDIVFSAQKTRAQTGETASDAEGRRSDSRVFISKSDSEW